MKVSVGVLFAIAEALIVVPLRKNPMTGSETVTHTALADWPFAVPACSPPHCPAVGSPAVGVNSALPLLD